MRGMPKDAEKNPDADKLSELRDMEGKVRRLRETRNNLRDQGKAMAQKRNALGATLRQRCSRRSGRAYASCVWAHRLRI